MKIGITVSDLTEHQWDTVQRAVMTQYEIPARAVRVCALFTRDDLERHVEMPIRAFMAVVDLLEREGYRDLSLKAFAQVGEQMAGRPIRTPAPINDLVARTPSVFPGQPDVITYGDGSQQFGPYTR